MDIVWVCDICGEELITGEEMEHACFLNASQVFQVGDSNRLNLGPGANCGGTSGEAGCSNSNDLDISDILIIAVQNRPGLYDHRLPLAQRSRQIVTRLWQEVYDEISSAEGGHFNNIQDIQVRWRSLRDRFVKEYSEVNIYKPTGSEAAKKKKNWKYYESMLFLKDIVKPKKTVGNVSVEGSDKNSLPGPSKSYSPGPSSSSSSNNSFTSPNNDFVKHGHKRKAEKDSIAKELISAFKETQPPVPDEVDAFCSRLASSLRRLPRRDRCQLEIKFLQDIYDVEEKLGLND